jgi:hypothetical protein
MKTMSSLPMSINEPRKNARWRRLLGYLLQAIVLIIVAVFVIRYLGDQWAQIQDSPPQINWLILLASQLGLTVGLALLPLGGWRALHDLDADLPPVTVWRIFFLSNIAKYLPGSVWALPGRAFLYQRAGVPVSRSVAAVFWEVVLMIFSAGTLALFAIRLVGDILPSAVFIALEVLLVFGSFGAYWLLRSPGFHAAISRLPLPNIVMRLLENESLWLSIRQIVRVVIFYWLAWIVIGLSFAGSAYAVSSHFPAHVGLELVGLYAGAWLVGFLVIIAPGGIGVRDVLLTVGLSVVFNDPLPAVIAIVARIAWTLAEVIGVIVTSAIYHRASNS